MLLCIYLWTFTSLSYSQGGYIVINLVGSFNEEEDLGATLNLKIFDIVFEGRNDE